jgi:PAS domain S-box-containing protein
VRHRNARIGIAYVLFTLAFATAEAQERRTSTTGLPSHRVAIPAESASRTAAHDTSSAGAGPILVFNGPGGSHRRITGWPAGVIIFSFFAGLFALVWRLLRLRRRARVLTRRGENQYRMLFERNPGPMFAYDTRTLAILTVNHAAAELLGHTNDAFTQLTLRDLLAPEVAADATQALCSAADTNQDSALLTRMSRQNGVRIDVDVRGRPLDGKGSHACLVMMLDVTERLAAERALRESEQRARTASEVLRSLIDVAPQAIIALDRDYRVTLWNRAAEILFGWSAAEVLGRDVPYVPPEHRESFLERKRSIDRRGAIEPSEVTRMRKDGTRVELLAASGTVEDVDGTASGYIGVFTDLTHHHLLEAQLRQSQKLEAVGRLAGGIAHDFNNVLTIITSYVQVLQAQHDRDAGSEELAEIAAAARRAAALTRQLLTFSRKQMVHLATVNVNDVVTAIEPMLRRVGAENIQLRTSLAPDLGSVFADAAQLEQVILNLAVNASDAMPDGGSLVLETANVELDDDYVSSHADVIPGPYVMLAASDTGSGMNEATLARIFEPFFTTKEPGRGTGLGLAMAYEVIRQARGHFWVYSELDGGTTFKIYLPRVDAAAQWTTTPSQPMAEAGRGGTVLLVEDDEAVRRSVRSTLVRQGYVVLEASDGESGLAVAERQGGAIDVVVTDLMMPGMSGREFADRLALAQPHLKVVFTSGYTDDEVMRRRLVEEGQPFLQKPFTSDQLVSAIEARRREDGGITRPPLGPAPRNHEIAAAPLSVSSLTER